MARAEVLFDFDYSDLEGMKTHAERVRWIQASSAGIGQFVKRHGLSELDATLTTAAGVHARPLAEFVVWATLSFTKNYPRARKQQREHVWKRFHNDDLEGKTLAVGRVRGYRAGGRFARPSSWRKGRRQQAHCGGAGRLEPSAWTPSTLSPRYTRCLERPTSSA